MEERIINAQAKEFIDSHKNDNPAALRLSWHGKDPGFDVDFAIIQIEARRKCASKIPYFIHEEDFLFPDTSIAEQASNQFISLYHASLIGKENRIADLTAGLGIDAFTLSIAGNEVLAKELDPCRAKIMDHNSKALNLSNFQILNTNSIDFLITHPEERFDWIFIDPARRDMANNRSFLLQDSIPDVVKHQDLLLSRSDDVLIKASPLLDISKTICDFSKVKTIHIVSYKGECKEILIHLSNAAESKDPEIRVVDIAPSDDYKVESLNIKYQFAASYSELGSKATDYAPDDFPVSGMYVYEAGAGMRKLKCVSTLQQRYPQMRYLIDNSFLFVSQELYPDFPGRISMIQRKLEGKGANRALKDAHLRVVSSGHPQPADQLRKKYKIAEGSGHSVYFSRLVSGKPLTLVTKDL